MRARDLLFLLSVACAPQEPAPPTLTYTFGVDAPTGAETYTCYAFDAGPLRDRWVRAIRWTPPSPGDVLMHHATLYAVPSWSQGAVSTCWDMPSPSTGLQVWAPGGDDLVFPSDMGLVLPPDTTTLVVQVHALRTADGPPAQATVSVDTIDVAPARVAAWMVVSAPIPAIRPHMTETSTAECTAAAGFHVIGDWPHMHLAGAEFHGAILRQSGAVDPLVDVVPWDFNAQRTYPLDVAVGAGERVQTTCIWQNNTDHYIFGGPQTTDEMCNQALLVWPAASASWAGSCP